MTLKLIFRPIFLSNVIDFCWIPVPVYDLWRSVPNPNLDQGESVECGSNPDPQHREKKQQKASKKIRKIRHCTAVPVLDNGVFYCFLWPEFECTLPWTKPFSWHNNFPNEELFKKWKRKICQYYFAAGWNRQNFHMQPLFTQRVGLVRQKIIRKETGCSWSTKNSPDYNNHPVPVDTVYEHNTGTCIKT